MAFKDKRPDVHINDMDGNPLVKFKFKQPSISVDTSARYATHDVIGDTTVRQKMGDSPDEISMEGHCTEWEANDVDRLPMSDKVEVISSRWEGICQVASTSTSPITDGGGQDKDEEWVHDFTIELVETMETGGSIYGDVEQYFQ